jgi:putative intracellular protease/amidase
MADRTIYNACLQGGDWSSHVVTDGKLITGQNPQSSEVSMRMMPSAWQAMLT